MAVNLEHYILVLGGISLRDNESNIPLHEIWTCNLYTEQWKKHVLSQSKVVPTERICACAVAMGSNVYMFGGSIKAQESIHGQITNSMWKLGLTSQGSFAWSEIVTRNNEKAPSPRQWHSGWEYGGLFWTFGGAGYSPAGYLDEHGDFIHCFNSSFTVNNQLLCYSPVSEEWTNPQCFGQIPKPRCEHANTSSQHRAWLYGGNNTVDELDDLYELNMHDFGWTQIKTNQVKPQVRMFSTLSAISHDKLVLHGGYEWDEGGYGWKEKYLQDTWLIDLPSQAWRHLASVKDVPRERHTSSRGINNSLLFVGGTVTQQSMTKSTFQLMLEPKCLQQLAVKIIYNHRRVLPWDELPEKLIVLLLGSRFTSYR